jgi:hypothetical protein
MKAFDIDITLALRAVIHAETEADAERLGRQLAERVADVNSELEGRNYGTPEATEFSLAYHRDDECDVTEAYDLAELEGTDETELGDHATSDELEPEAGYILLDATDGEGEELATYLDKLPNAVVQRIMCCNIDDVNGAIVKRTGQGTPALEIWATTANDPSSGHAGFCRIF